MSTRDTIRGLARSRKVQVSVHSVAAAIAGEAKRIDSTGDFRVDDTIYNVAGLDRVVTTVTNHAPDAAKKEFGGERQSGVRPIGRAASFHRG